MAARKIVSAVVVTAGLVLVAVAGAWACTSAGGPYLVDPAPNRSAVGTTALVKGAGWASSSPVQVGWRLATAADTQPLTSAQTDTGGAFSVDVTIPDAPAGIVYLSATQGGTTRLMPFEVTAPEGSARALAAKNPAPLFDALATSGAPLPGLGEPAAAPAGPSTFPVPALAAAGAGALALFGVGAVELRRRRSRLTLRTR